MRAILLFFSGLQPSDLLVKKWGNLPLEIIGKVDMFQIMKALKVLIVDDHRDAAIATGYFVKKMNHEVHYAFNGKDAVEKAKSVLPDLIILDISMPEMDGLEACRQMRLDDKLKQTKIVAQTGWDETELSSDLASAGFDKCLNKPVQRQVLQDLVNGIH